MHEKTEAVLEARVGSTHHKSSVPNKVFSVLQKTVTVLGSMHYCDGWEEGQLNET